MGRALPTWMRQRIVEEYLAATKNPALTDSPRTTRRPDPGNQNFVYRAARYLKFLHHSWGAALIRLKLNGRYPGPYPACAPSSGKKEGLQPMRKRLPDTQRRWAQTPHEISQRDAKERITLREGEPAT